MERHHKQLINTNMALLVENTSDEVLDKLVDYLVLHGVFTNDMAQKFTDPEESQSIKKISFYFDIQTRGPRAFAKLIDAFQVACANGLVAILSPSDLPDHVNNAVAPAATTAVATMNGESTGSQPRGARPFRMMQDERNDEVLRHLEHLEADYPNAKVNLSKVPLVVNVEKAVVRLDKLHSSVLPHYHMGSRPKGLALIINNYKFQGDTYEYRSGAEHDSTNMAELCRQLGYETESYHNLSKADMIEKIRTFAGRHEHYMVSSCIVCIMSHGSKGNTSPNDVSTVIYGVDGLSMTHMQIVEKFNSINCPGLINKPKVFIIQSCRGSEKNHRISNISFDRTQTDGVGSYHPIRTLSDVLIGYATPTGYEAIRDIYSGSWYVQTICHVFMKYARDMHVQDMLNLVDHKMSTYVTDGNGLQTATFENIGFTKRMYICPGLYDDDERDAASTSSNFNV